MKKLLYVFVMLCVSAGQTIFAQSEGGIIEGIPEVEGVSSASIIDFLDAAAKSNSEFHSLIMMRHGKVVAKGWWNPYRPELKHMMYSTSKSFTSTAIGFAVAEHRLTVNDKVIGFFKDILPDTVSTFLAGLTVKDLLTMSVGQKSDPTGTIFTKDNWVKQFLAIPIQEKPGTHFLYNSMATYTLSAIVQKVTGEKEIDYLKPRLFDPLGISGIDWELSPEGVNSGGWGLRLKTEDMVKFGQLYLQKGRWKGKQILPETWVEEATAKHIDPNPEATVEKRNASDWLQGYGYQFWRCRNNGYRADGAFGQFIIVLPDQDAVIAITCNSTETQNELDLVWRYLLPALHPGKLPANKSSDAQLKNRLAALALPGASKSNPSSIAAQLSGRNFQFAVNREEIGNVSFRFKNDSCYFTLRTNKAVYPFVFSSGWAMSATELPGPALTAGAKGNTVGLPPFKVAGHYNWTSDNTLQLTLRYIEGPHKEIFTCHFDQQKVSITVDKTLSDGSKNKDTSVLEGEMK